MENNLDNGWRLRDVPRIAWGNIQEWWHSLRSDREMVLELVVYALVVGVVWLILAGLFFVGMWP